MTQLQINAIRTLAQKAINAHREATKKLGRTPTPAEVKTIWQPIREQAWLISNKTMGLEAFNVEIRKVATGK